MTDFAFFSIDILASKLVVTNHIKSSNDASHANCHGGKSTSKTHRSPPNQDISLYSINHIETRVEAKNGAHRKGKMTDSRERIIEVEASSINDYGDIKGDGINKTVEFEFTESSTV
jgi:hypothetical protein